MDTLSIKILFFLTFIGLALMGQSNNYINSGIPNSNGNYLGVRGGLSIGSNFFLAINKPGINSNGAHLFKLNDQGYLVDSVEVDQYLPISQNGNYCEGLVIEKWSGSYIMLYRSYRIQNSSKLYRLIFDQNLNLIVKDSLNYVNDGNLFYYLITQKDSMTILSGYHFESNNPVPVLGFITINNNNQQVSQRIFYNSSINPSFSYSGIIPMDLYDFPNTKKFMVIRKFLNVPYLFNSKLGEYANINLPQMHNIMPSAFHYLGNDNHLFAGAYVDPYRPPDRNKTIIGIMDSLGNLNDTFSFDGNYPRNLDQQRMVFFDSTNVLIVQNSSNYGNHYSTFQNNSIEVINYNLNGTRNWIRNLGEKKGLWLLKVFKLNNNEALVLSTYNDTTRGQYVYQIQKIDKDGNYISLYEYSLPGFSFSVYPNPVTHGEVTVSGKLLIDDFPYPYCITSPNGQVLQNGTLIKGEQISINPKIKGVNYLTITNENGFGYTIQLESK